MDSGCDRGFHRSVYEAIDRLKRDRRVRIVSVPSEVRARSMERCVARGARDSRAAGQHDALSPSALYEIADALEEPLTVILLYSDEDRIPADGSFRQMNRTLTGTGRPTFCLRTTTSAG